MIPVEVEMEVIAENEQTALQIGQSKFKEDPSGYLIGNSEDYSAAHDWEPFAQETHQ